MSQLFILYFSEMVPIEVIIEELQSLEIVDYAHGPIRARMLVDPKPDKPEIPNPT